MADKPRPAADAPTAIDELRAILQGPQLQALEVSLTRLQARQGWLRRTLRAQIEAQRAQLFAALNRWKQRHTRRRTAEVARLTELCERLGRRLDRQARQLRRLRQRHNELRRALAEGRDPVRAAAPRRSTKKPTRRRGQRPKA